MKTVELESVRKTFKVPVLTDVHEDTPLAEVAAVVDVLQTPAFLCRQTNFILSVAACGTSPSISRRASSCRRGKCSNVVDKARSTGNADIMVCERGFSFGYNNLITDMRALSIMRETGSARWCSTPRIRCSCPAAAGTSSGGQREFVPVLARAAVAAGVAGRVHGDASRARQGALGWPQRLAAADRMAVAALETLVELDRTVKKETLRGIPTYEPYRRNPRSRNHGFPRQSRRSKPMSSWSDGVVRAVPPSPPVPPPGTREAVELRDGDAKRYGGKGVLQSRRACEHEPA